jgi:hypothetical protein
MGQTQLRQLELRMKTTITQQGKKEGPLTTEMLVSRLIEEAE